MNRWFCPNCERLVLDPPFRDGDKRFHSYHCRTPLQYVSITFVSHPSDVPKTLP